jgi:hypothetical protein
VREADDFDIGVFSGTLDVDAEQLSQAQLPLD